MLKTERNTPTMQNRVVNAACRYFHNENKHGIFAIFEHGQWWIELRDGSQYSVCDAEGGYSVDGFSFEQVTAGQE